MDLVTKFIDAVKTPVDAGINAGHVITVVGKLLAGCETRGFADDFVALNDQLFAVVVLNHPFSSEQCDNAIGTVEDRYEIDERMGFVRRQCHPPVMVHKFVETSGQAFKRNGSGHYGGRNALEARLQTLVRHDPANLGLR